MERARTMPSEPRPVTPVGILAETLAAARARLGEMADPDPELAAYVERAAALAAGLDPYLERCSSPESPALAALAERTREFDWDGREEGAVALEQEMLSGHLEGRFLAMLVRATRAWRVLEIGTFTGYSALAMAEALPADGRLVACELDPEAAEVAREGFAGSPAGAKIELRVGDAAATIDDLVEVGDAFDLVFVDADKAGYGGYVDSILGRGLLTPGGLICVDNTLLQGEPYLDAPRSPNGEAIAAFNQRLRENPGIETVLVPLRDGITLIRQRDASEIDG
jgi:caffeoyl-CoA O-methyltransferase